MKVAGQSVNLERPARASVRFAIAASLGQRDLVMVQQTARQVVAATLFMCWPDVWRKAGAPQYHGNLLEFGADVIDFLVDVGSAAGQAEDVTMQEIIVAGNAAADFMQRADAPLTAEDLGQARGNSPPTTANGSATSGGSRSPGPDEPMAG